MSFVGVFIFFYVFVVWLVSEIEVGFFNIFDVEEEIVEGFFVEYSGRYLVFFKLMYLIKVFILVLFVVVIFFLWGILGYFGLSGFLVNVVDLFFYMFKVFVVFFVV